ncbi:MAG TPA: nucleotide kinase domain-containing protein [Stellaceae bacterium]|nr:nucleotide kinase domain-containing protein [Stellaceae bacterium]
MRKKLPKPIAKRPRGRPQKTRIDPAAATLPLDLPIARRASEASTAAPPTPIILRHLVPAKVSEVYESYWRFAAERQDVFFRRARGEARPWTGNAVLTTYKFTNAYRASDRASQYLIRHVIYRADLPNSPREVFFRILLFKLFNKIETWQLLERSFGAITFEDYHFSRYDEVLAQAMRDGRRIYSAAYIMPPGSSAFGRPAKHQNHLLLLERMMEDRLPERLAQTRTMQDGFEKLRAYPTIGDFLAYQFITDINYSEITDFSEMDFVVPGPGARDGLQKCFADTGGLNEPELIRLMADLQEQEFERLGLDFQSLWGRRLQLIDCQNLFCEVDKYARVAHPQIAGRTGRTRIKQKFEPTLTPIELFYPPKWKLNEKIRAGVETPLGAIDGARSAAG